MTSPTEPPGSGSQREGALKQFGGIFFDLGPLRSRPKRKFNKQGTSELSYADQVLFEKFAQGPLISLPYACIHHAFESQAEARPHAVAAIYGDQQITYRELNEAADRLASLLIKMGVSRGDRVGVFLQRSVSMLIGILATLKAGAAYVPQDPRITPARQLQHVIAAADMNLILTTPETADLIPDVPGVSRINIDEFLAQDTVPTVDTKLDTKSDIQIDTQALAKRQDQVRDQDVCFVLFTSGTTGLPNGVQVTHRNVCNIILTEPGNLGIQAGDRVSQILNIAFDMAAWEIFGALSHGATLIIRGKDIQQAVSLANIVIATPSVLSRIDADVCQHVKTVAVAGEPCPKPLADKWSAFATFYNSCGPTEVTIVNTMQAYSRKAGRITIGRPTPNNTVYILDENLKPCPIGEIGEMWAGGDCVSIGYIGNDVLTEERYKPDPFLGGGRKMFRTRDLGRWTKNGELEHFGRTDDQVKIRGFRVELDSVSRALESVPGCVQAITLKLDDRNLVSFVTPATVDIARAKNMAQTILPYYCNPSLILPMEEFPTTSRGKIDKRRLTVMAVEAQEKAL